MVCIIGEPPWKPPKSQQPKFDIMRYHRSNSVPLLCKKEIFAGETFSTFPFNIKAGPPPLEAILVIFGRRALIFFFLFESSWKKMKNDATFVRMRSGDHLGDAKMLKKGTSLRRI